MKSKMMLPTVLLITIAATASAQGDSIPDCVHTQLTGYGSVLPGDEPCLCRGQTALTVCHPYEICFPVPTAEAEEMMMEQDEMDEALIENVFTTALDQCVALPCDDLSGHWIWYGRNPRPWIQGDFTVWATVDIEQENCEFVLTSTSNIGADGTILEEAQTRDYYGGMFQPQELTSFALFDTQEDRENFKSLPAGADPSPMQNNMYIFIQDFGNGAPEVQCSLFGNLVYKGFASNALPEDVDSFDGTLARDVAGQFSIGDTIAADGNYGDWDGGCPEDYPRPWFSSPFPGSLEVVKCCNPAAGPGGCPDENGSFENCWDEGGYCCSDGNWYADPGDGSGNCQDKQLIDSDACAASWQSTSGCLLDDILYSEGDIIGQLGFECIDDKTYDGTETQCGLDGNLIQAGGTFTCPESAPYCVQCGPRGAGNALCLSTSTTDRDCGDASLPPAVGDDSLPNDGIGSKNPTPAPGSTTNAPTQSSPTAVASRNPTLAPASESSDPTVNSPSPTSSARYVVECSKYSFAMTLMAVWLL